MNAVSQILGALIEAWGEVKVQKARVVLSLVGVVAAVAAMTIVIALGDLLLQSSRELAELYEGRSVTLRLTPESSSNAPEGPAAGGPYQDASDPAAATGAQTAKRPDEKDTIGEAMGTLAERTDIHYWSRFSSGGGEIVETRQARASGQFRGYPLTKIGDMVDGVAFQGVDPSYAVIYRTRMLAGRWVESSDADQRLIPVVISQTLWEQLGAPYRSGADRPAHERRRRDARRRRHQVEELLRHADRVRALRRARVSFPGMTSPAMIAWVGTENADQARENLPRALASILGEGWKVSISGGEHEDIGEEQLGTISNVIMVIGGIIVFLGALGLLNVAIVTVRQRVREIGIRRAVGASAARVFFAVFMESVVATFVAGVIGVGIAVVVVRFLPLEALNITLSDTPAFPAGAAIAGVAISTSIGALCGIIPALAAVRIKPIDAIRY